MPNSNLFPPLSGSVTVALRPPAQAQTDKWQSLKNGALCHVVPFVILPPVIDVTVVTPGSGLRQRKKAQTRHAIEARALELFLRDGYEATTIDAITAACDISPRTFFRYFSSKDDILQGDNDVRLRHLLDLLKDRPADESPLRALRQAVVALTGRYEDDKEHLLLRFRVFERNPALLARGLESQHAWEQAIVRALDERHGAIGFLYDRLELRLIAAAGMASLRAAVDVWQSNDDDTPLSDLVARAFDRLGTGLDTHQGTGDGTKSSVNSIDNGTSNGFSSSGSRKAVR